MTVENISWSISTKEFADLGGGWTRDLLVSSRTAHPTEPPRPAVRLESLLSTWRNFASLAIKMHPGKIRMRSLIRIFAGRKCQKVSFLTLWLIRDSVGLVFIEYFLDRRKEKNTSILRMSVTLLPYFHPSVWFLAHLSRRLKVSYCDHSPSVVVVVHPQSLNNISS